MIIRFGRMDVFIEVHDEENSKTLFDYFKKFQLNIFHKRLAGRKHKHLEAMQWVIKKAIFL